MPTDYATMRAAYPATIRNDRLRKRVKWLIKNGDDELAWDAMHAASVKRAKEMQLILTNNARTIRNGYFDWKVADEKKLKSIFIEANDQIAARLARLDPEGIKKGYVHQRGLMKDIDRRIEIINARIEDHTDKAMLTAGSYGQHAFLDGLATLSLPNNVFDPYGPTSSLWATANEDAVRAVLTQDYSKVPLSKRIWRHSKAARAGIQRTIAVGVAQGRGVDDIARGIREYMIEPAQRSRTVARGYRKTAKAARDSATKIRKDVEEWRLKLEAASPAEKDRLLGVIGRAEVRIVKLDKKARSYYALAHANEGVIDKGLYKSWYKNARRMVREETNRVYREAFMQSAKQYDFVLHQWTLAAGHPKPDVCDDLAARDSGHGAGIYTAMEYPLIAHIGCLCYDIPVVIWDKVYPGSREASYVG